MGSVELHLSMFLWQTSQTCAMNTDTFDHYDNMIKLYELLIKENIALLSFIYDT